MKEIILIAALIASAISIKAQGPPITADKPIMLGGKAVVIKTLTEIRNTDRGTFARIPLMIHYLPSSNSLVAIHIPWTHYNFEFETMHGAEDGGRLGDIGILGKYQFYRKDGKAKTYRMVLKTYQNLPTGLDAGPREISSGTYQSYLGWVTGYETIKYGLSTELGYNLVPSGDFDEVRMKLGLGLPLLKPKYPVNQINLYFEYASNWRHNQEAFEILYSQGLQYARGRLTIEAAVQLPLFQNDNIQFDLNSNVLLGTRYIF